MASNHRPTISELVDAMSADIDPGPTPEEFARVFAGGSSRKAPTRTGPRVDACREDDDD